MTPDRPGRHRRIRTQRKLARQQMLHAVVVHDQHDEIHGLSANLESKAPAFDRKESRRTPSLRCAAACDSASVLRAEYKSALQHRWHHGDALCFSENFLRDSRIRCRLNLV